MIERQKMMDKNKLIEEKGEEMRRRAKAQKIRSVAYHFILLNYHSHILFHISSLAVPLLITAY